MIFADVLGIKVVSASKTRAEVTMPITTDMYQPYGFVHGGVTISMLETCASLGAAESVDLETQLPFGVNVDIRHRKSAKSGTMRGVAELDHEEPSHTNGIKQFWKVAAYDDDGDVISDGTIIVKIVSREYYAQKEAARKAAAEGAALPARAVSGGEEGGEASC